MINSNGGSRSAGSGNGNGKNGKRGLYTYPTTNEFEPITREVTNGVVVSGSLPPDDNDVPLNPAEAFPATEVLTGDEAQYENVRDAIYQLLDAFQVNWDDPNYTETPDRVARAYLNYWANGYGRKPEDEVTVFPNSSGAGDLVLVKDMRFFSMCSHHLAPFSGYGAVAYIANEKLLGLSKLGRILDIFARRFQLQERIGAQVADSLMELIAPQGVMVVLYNVEHMCMSSRGVQMHEASTTTVATRGVFQKDAAQRNQVLAMLRA